MRFQSIVQGACLFALGACLFAVVPNACADSYQVTNLVSDGTISAAHTDSKLVNAWGLAFNPAGFWWVSDNGTGLSTLYDNSGNIISLVVTVPGPAGSNDPSAPTGIVYNGGSGFVVSSGGASGPSLFIFCTEDGTISGWNQGVPPPATSTKAINVVDRSAQGAIYKGLALASGRLYATDFHNARIDVFNDSFAPVTLAAGAFTDPSLPAKYAPFNVASVGDRIYVAYALQDDDAKDEVAGDGNGIVDEFDVNGTFVRRFASGGTLNAPWAIVQATSNFGPFSNNLLIGNFGDGTINAFDITSGTFLGQLKDTNNKAIVIDGLWGLAFGTGSAANDLFFAAGPDEEAHGLFGKVTVQTTVIPMPRHGICGAATPAYLGMSLLGLLSFRLSGARTRRLAR